MTSGMEARGLAAVLRSRGRNNSLHDINRAADMLEALSASTTDSGKGRLDAEARLHVDEAMVERALHARVPGGSEVWCWLPQKDAWTPHQTARDVMECALNAALNASQAHVKHKAEGDCEPPPAPPTGEGGGL